ncbi:MAG: metal ABC transporter solute-binding protein, Zn/Mn family [Porticoccaceae bacterium]
MKQYNIAFKLFCLSVLIALTVPISTVSAQDSAKPLVVTSIKPLAIIVKSAFQDRVEVEYLMPAALSPHDVVLKVSDMRTLSTAELVFWVGPEFESSAAKQFSAVATSKRVTAMELVDSEHGLSADDNHKDDHHEHDHGFDPHIWLSPTIVRQLVKTLSAQLKIPAQDIFDAAAEKSVKDLLIEAKNGNYIVHHQAFDYFIDEFGLQPGLPIRDMLGKQQGAKTQYNLRLEGKKLGVSCVFIEPQHGHKDAMAVANELAVPTKVIDILAVTYPSKLPTYESYIYGLAQQFNACFK